MSAMPPTAEVNSENYRLRDGRCVAKRQFNENIARYHSEYGLHNLSAGNLKTANRAFLKAWSRHPQNWKSLAFIPAALLGWRPKW